MLGLALALLVAESVCKVIDLRNRLRHHRIVSRISRISDIPGVRYELVPNLETVTPNHDQVIRINNLGFRGHDVTPDKPPSLYRIAILGDSIAFARGYAEKDIFPAILERNLNAGNYGKDFEVVNASLSGRDTWEECAILEHRVLALKPDLVILQICLNDHVRLPFPKKDATVGIFGEQAWYEYSSLLKLLDQRIEGFRKIHAAVIKKIGWNKRAERVILDRFIGLEELLNVEPDWPAWSAILLKIRDLTTSHGAGVMFLVCPVDIEVRDLAHDTLPMLTGFTQENGIPYLDLLTLFEADGGIKLFADHIHPNPEGHRVIAKEIERFIAGHFLSLCGGESTRR